MWIKHGKIINQRMCYNRIWSWSPMLCVKHGPRASITTQTSALGLGFCLLSPSGHVFHSAWETMIKSYSICVCVALTRGHYSDVIMGAMASQITSLTIINSTVYSGADQRKYQSSASLAFVRGIHRWPVDSPHKGPVTRKMFPFDDVIWKQLLAVRVNWKVLTKMQNLSFIEVRLQVMSAKCRPFCSRINAARLAWFSFSY